MEIISYSREELLHIVGLEYLTNIGSDRKSTKLELDKLMIILSKWKNLDIDKCNNPKIVNNSFQFEYKK